ncbi:MAG: formylglycine-generating enzyme family protein [Verrucomicrobiia bacterium]
MTTSGKLGKFITWLIGVVVLIAVVWFVGDRLNHWYRKRWHFVAWMQDLPPVDRSTWPKTPVAWSNESVDVQVATPDGLKGTNITYFINSMGMKFVRIEPGTFVMGLDEELSKEVGPNHPLGGPMYVQHRVTLTKPYYMAAFDVTNKQYDQYDTQHRHHRPEYQLVPGGDNHPVEPVTWQDAQLFCRWLSAREGRLYRLPTEAEWEYACRAGTTNRTYWGGNVEDRTKANLGGTWDKRTHAHYADDGFEYTAPVGSFPPNSWGLYDMIGNSWEWVSDWYSVFATNDVVDPPGPPMGVGGPCRGGSLGCRVDKGGAWRGALHYASSALRDGDDPGDVKDSRGFRILCEVE